MRFCIQVVKQASVSVAGEVCGAIGNGFLVLIGVSGEDDMAIADKMTDKLLKMRICKDGDGKTNLSLADTGGELLLVSQFTLYADCRHGNRPGFTNAAAPDKAEALYEYIVKRCRERIPKVECGRFGEYMEVQLINDGPFTVWLDSDELLKKK